MVFSQENLYLDNGNETFNFSPKTYQHLMIFFMVHCNMVAHKKYLVLTIKKTIYLTLDVWTTGLL